VDQWQKNTTASYNIHVLVECRESWGKPEWDIRKHTVKHKMSTVISKYTYTTQELSWKA